MDEHRLRKARNEDLFRKVNEQIESLNEAFADMSGSGEFQIVCECDRVECNERLQIAQDAYRAARRDARIFLVGLAFLSSAGFLGLHALATPQVLLAGRTPGFVIATPVGLFIGAGFAALSSLNLEGAGGAALVRRQALLRGGVGLLLVV